MSEDDQAPLRPGEDAVTRSGIEADIGRLEAEHRAALASIGARAWRALNRLGDARGLRWKTGMDERDALRLVFRREVERRRRRSRLPNRVHLAHEAGEGERAMTPDERNLLQTFLADVERPAGSVAKDQEADAMIQDAVRGNPDAVYLLVQHAILADQALHAAQAQLEALQGSGAPSAGSSFLPVQAQPYDPTPSAPWAGPGGTPVPSSPFAANSGLGSFLRSAGTMAAGVAAGDFLAQGLSNLFAPRW